jgi:GntR family transcriptional regulator
MVIRIETASGRPISRQIADQIRSHSVSGALLPGDRLPSVRQLARELGVNQNTILHVYERLTTEGLLERRQGDGTYVAERLPRGQVAAQRELLQSEIDRLCHRAADLWIGGEEMRKLLGEALERIGKERRIEKAVAAAGVETREQKEAEPEAAVDETVAETKPEMAAETEAKIEAEAETRQWKGADQWRNW